jgi:hypothetical protein
MDKEISAFIPIENFEPTLRTKDVAAITGLTQSGVGQAAKFGNIPNEKRIDNNMVVRFYSPGDVQFFKLKRERRLRDALNWS